MNEMEAMHQSAPNMYYESEPEDVNMEPIPVNLNLPDLASSTKPPPVRATFTGNDEPMTISGSLIESLAKITESAGADDNPFEPIPLSPPSKKRASIPMSKDEFSNMSDRRMANTFECDEDE